MLRCKIWINEPEFMMYQFEGLVDVEAHNIRIFPFSDDENLNKVDILKRISKPGSIDLCIETRSGYLYSCFQCYPLPGLSNTTLDDGKGNLTFLRTFPNFNRSGETVEFGCNKWIEGILVEDQDEPILSELMIGLNNMATWIDTEDAASLTFSLTTDVSITLGNVIHYLYGKQKIIGPTIVHVKKKVAEFSRIHVP